MTAAAFVRADPKPTSDTTPDSEAARYRALWSAVLLAACNDWWHATRRAKRNAARLAEIRADALQYFASRDGRTVLALAGITADPEQLADAAVDLTAYDRTFSDDRHDARRRARA